MDAESRDLQSERPARLTTSGIVRAVDDINDSFTVSISQSLYGLTDAFPLDVRTQCNDLPVVGSVVMFNGEFVGMDNGVAVTEDDECTPF